MHAYTAQIVWSRGDQLFVDNRYSRRYAMSFDGGVSVPGSASPHVVRVPMSDPSALDPEEAFVASLSGCHMLWFLSIAAERGFRVDTYADHAQGQMQPNAQNRLAMTLVLLRPIVMFSGSRIPTREEFCDMHETAHQECFLANSVTAQIRCEPVMHVTGRGGSQSMRVSSA